MDKPLLQTLKRVPSSKTPIWIMRQAGRYLPEYREVRSNFNNFIEFCMDSEASAHVTLQPLRRFDLDAAIIFSDILMVPKALGMDVAFVQNEGPKLDAISTPQDVERYLELDDSIFNGTIRAISIVKQILQRDFPDKALIGFAGAPFTVASYMIEGGSSRDFHKTLQFGYLYSTAFEKLLEALSQTTIEYLKMQIEAGADVIKIFDSWAHAVPNALFDKYVKYPIDKILKSVKESYPEVKSIVFARRAQSNLWYHNNIDAIAIDQSTDIAWSYQHLKTQGWANPVLQGNMDNLLLAVGDKAQITQGARDVLQKAADRPLIFNLGHGILPQTPIENLEHMISIIRKYGNK